MLLSPSYFQFSNVYKASGLGSDYMTCRGSASTLLLEFICLTCLRLAPLCNAEHVIPIHPVGAPSEKRKKRFYRCSLAVMPLFLTDRRLKERKESTEVSVG